MSIRDIIPINGNKYNLNPQTEIRRCVAAGIDINETIENGNTALHYAADRGWIDYIKVLVECGIEVNKQNAKGETAIELIAKKDRWPEYEKLRSWTEPHMLIKCAKMNMYNTTVCMMIKDLEERINDVDIETGKTVLRIYADKKNKKAVEKVLRYGGDPYVEDNMGITAICKYPEKVKKSRMKFGDYIKYNRFNRKISRYIEEDHKIIPTPKGLLRILKKEDEGFGTTYYEEAKTIVERYEMHKLGVILIRVVPMMMIWRKRATERVYHPSKMKLEFNNLT